MFVRICSSTLTLRRHCLHLLIVACVAATLPAAARAQALPDFVELIERVAPAVVNIRTTPSSTIRSEPQTSSIPIC